MVCAADPVWVRGSGWSRQQLVASSSADDCGVSPQPGIPVCTARAALHPVLLQVSLFQGACSFGHCVQL